MCYLNPFPDVENFLITHTTQKNATETSQKLSTEKTRKCFPVGWFGGISGRCIGRKLKGETFPLDPPALVGGYNLHERVLFVDNRIVYDYLTFSSRIHSQSDLVEILGLENVVFEVKTGFYGYRYRWFFEGISIHFDGREDMGVCVEMSGKGCRTFEEFGNGDYECIFDLLRFHYAEKEMNITRLDVAYDDFVGKLNLDVLSRDTVDSNFVSRFRDWQVIQGNKGGSVNHGSRSSNVYIRIYDKALEQQVNVPHWVRLEIQMRKECAWGFVQLSEIIDHKFFAVLNEYLRYIQPDSSDSNKWRLPMTDYWRDFVDYDASVSIFQKPASDFNVGKLYDYITTQTSGACQTYIDIFGSDQFLETIANARKGKRLNPKYEQLKADFQAHGDAILNALGEFCK